MAADQAQNGSLKRRNDRVKKAKARDELGEEAVPKEVFPIELDV